MKTRDFTLLKKRIIFLTHNYIMNKKLTKGQIKAGIYFSYLMQIQKKMGLFII